MRQEIKITALDIDKYDDDFTKYQINISNETTSTVLDFYGYLNLFKEFASRLMLFPDTIDDVIVFEIGEDVKNWAYYLLLKVYCFERSGKSAIYIKIDNHREAPFHNRVEFSIQTTPASLNKLGTLLNSWNPEAEKEIIWLAE